MGLFTGKNSTSSYGAIVDIGSGSVLAAIVKSDKQLSYPQIIWAKREYVPLRPSDSIQNSAKNVMSSLMNAVMLLDGEGRKTYEAVSGTKKIKNIQVSIAAPWSYTVTKDIIYNHQEDFVISAELVDELLRTAKNKVDEELTAQERIQKLGLTIINSTMIGLVANGYTIRQPQNQKARNLRIVQANAVAQDYLIKAIEETTTKLISEAETQLFSFMQVFYSVIREMQKGMSEYCLVDITFEATELGVVRDGLLQYTTHVPFGAFSIAREVSAVLNVPLEEAFGYLYQQDPITYLKDHHISSDKLQEVEKIYTAYENNLISLFQETGDSLSVPKNIFLHGNLYTEPFFMDRINTASKKATKTSHYTYPVSADLLKNFYPEELQKTLRESGIDTALFLSAQFFHMTDR